MSGGLCVLRNSDYTLQIGGDAKLQASTSGPSYSKIPLMLADDALATKILHRNDKPDSRQNRCQQYSLARSEINYQTLDPGLFLKANLADKSETDVEWSQTSLLLGDGIKSAIPHPLENLALRQWEAFAASYDSSRARSNILSQHIFETYSEALRMFNET